MSELLVLLFFLSLLWFWWDSLGAREMARKVGRQVCDKHDVQFLDDTVSVMRVRLKRDASGKVHVYREFKFEFSYSGEERSLGRITTFGRRVINVEIELKEF